MGTALACQNSLPVPSDNPFRQPMTKCSSTSESRAALDPTHSSHSVEPPATDTCCANATCGKADRMSHNIERALITASPAILQMRPVLRVRLKDRALHPQTNTEQVDNRTNSARAITAPAAGPFLCRAL